MAKADGGVKEEVVAVVVVSQQKIAHKDESMKMKPCHDWSTK
jgi:hypothetical protein